MMLQRGWITPIVTGTFLISAVTGVLLFFHLDKGLIKMAHQWLSWAFLVGAAFHVAINFSAIKEYLGSRKGKTIMVASCVILFLSFFSIGGRGQSPLVPVVDKLTHVPLTTLALIAEVDTKQLHERLSRSGISPKSDLQSISELVGQDRKKQFRVLVRLLDKKNDH